MLLVVSVVAVLCQKCVVCALFCFVVVFLTLTNKHIMLVVVSVVAVLFQKCVVCALFCCCFDTDE